MTLLSDTRSHCPEAVATELAMKDRLVPIGGHPVPKGRRLSRSGESGGRGRLTQVTRTILSSINPQHEAG